MGFECVEHFSLRRALSPPRGQPYLCNVSRGSLALTTYEDHEEDLQTVQCPVLSTPPPPTQLVHIYIYIICSWVIGGRKKRSVANFHLQLGLKTNKLEETLSHL